MAKRHADAGFMGQGVVFVGSPRGACDRHLIQRPKPLSCAFLHTSDHDGQVVMEFLLSRTGKHSQCKVSLGPIFGGQEVEKGVAFIPNADTSLGQGLVFKRQDWTHHVKISCELFHPSRFPGPNLRRHPLHSKCSMP